MKFLLLLILALPAFAETGADAWLRYTGFNNNSLRAYTLVTLGDSEVLASARSEILRALPLKTAAAPQDADMLVLATIPETRRAFPEIPITQQPTPDGYWLKQTVYRNHRLLLVTAANHRGLLYGTFALLRHLRLQDSIDQIDELSNPYHAIRWVNEWDNLDGSIERGYGGRSIFFADNNVVADLSRVSSYARLLASLGINGCTVNNVNANPRVLTPEFIPQLARLAAAFRPWGVRMSISVPFSSPKTVGGLDTFDPQDQHVRDWWRAKVDEIYRAIPDLAGFVVKADSEGQLGPSTYGRTHAEAANVLAEALRPHGGIVVYRGFVYNHHLDWHDLKNDRAKAAYDNFFPLDGKFDSNAFLQIKHGPIDFQAREPVSPLFSALAHTNETMELQITQEYTGQQRHLCYLVPMWKEVLNFNIATAKQPLKGLVGVSNVGLDANWMGADLAQANLYGFGRLAWDPRLSAAQITSEWTHMTWGDDPQVVATIMHLELESWSVYEGYTGPLGLGTLTDILRGHYGPGIESAENNGWGQWIRAGHQGIGMDRTVATGTGYIGQYPPSVAARFETLDLCRDNLLLFMHHVPYTYVLHSGKTVIQHVYDSHYDAAARAQQFPIEWRALENKIDSQRFAAVLARLDYQAGHAIVWRDAICNWFFHESGIPDTHGRVGHYPNRVEAEDMQLAGYKVIAIEPWEDASNGKGIACEQAAQCTATFTFKGAPGDYDLHVQYFDTNNGASHFDLAVANRRLDTWIADATFPTKLPNGDSSTRRNILRVHLNTGDEIKLTGTPGDQDLAALDYLEIDPI